MALGKADDLISKFTGALHLIFGHFRRSLTLFLGLQCPDHMAREKILLQENLDSIGNNMK